MLKTEHCFHQSVQYIRTVCPLTICLLHYSTDSSYQGKLDQQGHRTGTGSKDARRKFINLSRTRPNNAGHSVLLTPRDGLDGESSASPS